VDTLNLHFNCCKLQPQTLSPWLQWLHDKMIFAWPRDAVVSLVAWNTCETEWEDNLICMLLYDNRNVCFFTQQIVKNTSADDEGFTEILVSLKHYTMRPVSND
jgi:hypothetical protein